MTGADVVLLAIAVLGVGISTVSVLVGTLRLLTAGSPNTAAAVAPTLILPLTGGIPDIETLIARLGKQTLKPGRLIVAVEDEADPAYRRAKQALVAAAFSAEVVVAGLAEHQGQKCRNQQAALSRLADDDTVVVLMDGDILPNETWLETLVSPVADGEFHLSNGHRWQQVQKQRLGAHLVAAIDRAVSQVPRLDIAPMRALWGGSIAMRAQTARSLDLDGLLDRTLSDDLTLAARAASAGMTVATRSALLIATANGMAMTDAWNFARRQYQMCRIYRPVLWGVALTVIGLRVAAWIAALVLVLQGSPLGWWLAIALGLLGLAKQALVGALGASLGLRDPLDVRAVQYALGAVQFVPDLFHLGAVIGAGWTRRVRWGHVTYRVQAPDRITIIERRPYQI